MSLWIFSSLQWPPKAAFKGPIPTLHMESVTQTSVTLRLYPRGGGDQPHRMEGAQCYTHYECGLGLVLEYIAALKAPKDLAHCEGLQALIFAPFFLMTRSDSVNSIYLKRLRLTSFTSFWDS